MGYDDSDMKIAEDDFRPKEKADDSDETAQLLEKEKQNGNLSRARRLGAIMAEEVSAIEGSRKTDDSAILTQRRILLAFAVEVGLDAFLPNTLLSQTAQSIFYDTLRATASAFYEDLQESGAFSFYYLCVREKGDVDTKVGQTFASLCGKANDVDLAQRGAALYKRFIDQVHAFADTMDFVREKPEK